MIAIFRPLLPDESPLIGLLPLLVVCLWLPSRPHVPTVREVPPGYLAPPLPGITLPFEFPRAQLR